jgi:hypothetical protein
MSDDAIADANALLREKGYVERDLAVHAGPRGIVAERTQNLVPLQQRLAALVLRVVSDLVPTDVELGHKLLRPADLRARLGPAQGD